MATDSTHVAAAAAAADDAGVSCYSRPAEYAYLVAAIDAYEARR
jgi:hypothetical protein